MVKDNGAEALSRRRKGWEPETEVGDDGGCAGSAGSERFVTRAFRLLDVNHFLQYIHSTSISLYQRQGLEQLNTQTTYILASRICLATSITLFLGRNHPPLNLFYTLQFSFFIQVRLSIPPNRSCPRQFGSNEVREIRVTSFRHVPPQFWFSFLLE